jgi:hypothetical protein
MRELRELKKKNKVLRAYACTCIILSLSDKGGGGIQPCSPNDPHKRPYTVARCGRAHRPTFHALYRCPKACPKTCSVPHHGRLHSMKSRSRDLSLIQYQLTVAALACPATVYTLHSTWRLGPPHCSSNCRPIRVVPLDLKRPLLPLSF